MRTEEFDKGIILGLWINLGMQAFIFLFTDWLSIHYFVSLGIFTAIASLFIIIINWYSNFLGIDRRNEDD